MPDTCCITGCRSRGYTNDSGPTGHRFYRIPKVKSTAGKQLEEVTIQRRHAWIAAIGRTTVTFTNASKNLRVCSRHFHGGRPAYEMMKSDPDWAPSLHLGHTEVKTSDNTRHNRLKNRKDRKYFALQSQRDEIGVPSYEMSETDPDWVPTLHLGHDIHEANDKSRKRKNDRALLEQILGVKTVHPSGSKNSSTAVGNTTTSTRPKDSKKGSSASRKSSKRKGDTCCASGCRSGRYLKNGASKSFFHFPREEARCTAWLENMGRQDLQGKLPLQLRSEGYKICSDHFEADQFSYVGQTRTLTRSAVPSLLKASKRRPRERKAGKSVLPEVKLEIDYADDPTLFCGMQAFSPETTQEAPDLLQSATDSAAALDIKTEPVWENDGMALTSHTVTPNQMFSNLGHKAEDYVRTTVSKSDPRESLFSLCDKKTDTFTQASVLANVKSEPVDDDKFWLVDSKKATFGGDCGKVDSSDQVSGYMDGITGCCEAECDIKREPLDSEEWNSNSSQSLLPKSHAANRELVMTPGIGDDQSMVLKMEPGSDVDE
ncbi:uncharacterized protein LOC143297245 isoform X2 [Babylonia areolata]|uniref:uncharacterized protein LOC143297245 isoform X2 n=1 Tax=Babylonia areolata TaxID=304850 RepID=UPI003FCFE463